MYLIKDRTQVIDVIKKKFNEINTQNSNPLRVFRTDNALEYMQRDVSLLCESWAFFVKLLVVARLNKMVHLNVNIVICWMLLEPL